MAKIATLANTMKGSLKMILATIRIIDRVATTRLALNSSLAGSMSFFLMFEVK